MTPEPVTRYLAHCAHRNLRPTYIQNQRLTLQRLTAWMGTRPLFEASTTDLLEYLDSRPHQAGARAAEIAHLRGFYGWATDEELIAKDPARRIVRPRGVARLPRPMPDLDVARALAEAPCRVAPILNLAVYAGLRACEIAQLRAEDIQRDPPIIIVRESKGGGMSSVPLADLLADVLGRCPLPAEGWLFPRRDGTGHISRVRICQIANGYLRGLGIAHTLHSLRHVFGTYVYRMTQDIRLTQELMRHRSVESTVGYTKLDPTSGAAAVARLPAFAAP